LYSELEDANKKTETLAKDNEFLMEEMQSKCKQILQIYSKGFPDDNLVSMYSKLQRETEAEIIENIREEN
jgi:flagellar motility protein MotE (MotC chaperone)